MPDACREYVYSEQKRRPLKGPAFDGFESSNIITPTHTRARQSRSTSSFVVTGKSGIPENDGEKKRERDSERQSETEREQRKRERRKEGQCFVARKRPPSQRFQLHVHSFTAIRFPDTFVTLFALLNPFRNIAALDPFSLFARLLLKPSVSKRFPPEC